MRRHELRLLRHVAAADDMALSGPEWRLLPEQQFHLCRIHSGRLRNNDIRIGSGLVESAYAGLGYASTLRRIPSQTPGMEWQST